MGKKEQRLRDFFPISQDLPLPEGVSKEQIYEVLMSLKLSCEPLPHETASPLSAEEIADELAQYEKQHINRFIYTFGLLKGLKGKCLELGAYPYITTLMIEQFTDLQLELADYFYSYDNKEPMIHEGTFIESHTGSKTHIKFTSQNFNIEKDKFPFEDSRFEVVLFCELLEHLTTDPMAAMVEIKRILKPGGRIIISTPNVNSLGNVARMISGENIYYRYTGYGPYGRHNREYNISEIYELLRACGFTVETIFTVDTTENRTNDYLPSSELKHLLRGREHTLGQFIFARAISNKGFSPMRPSFLYSGYPSDQIDASPLFCAPQRRANEDVIEGENMELSCGWHSLESWGNLPTRWMGDNAFIAVTSEEDRKAVLSFDIISFHFPRTLELYIDDLFCSLSAEIESHKKVREVSPERFIKVMEEIHLKKGVNLLRMHSPEGATKPCDLPELKSPDSRPLGMAFQNIKLR